MAIKLENLRLLLKNTKLFKNFNKACLPIFIIYLKIFLLFSIYLKLILQYFLLKHIFM